MQVRVTRTDVSHEGHGWAQTPILNVTLSLGQLVDRLINCQRNTLQEQIDQKARKWKVINKL